MQRGSFCATNLPMSFKQLKLRVEQYTGLQTSDATDLAIVQQLINEAAREIYNTGDLPGLMDEAAFTFDPNYQIAIPTFSANIRGMRDYSSRAKQPLTGMGERYGNDPWYREWERFRVKANSPIQQEVSVASVLTLTQGGTPDGGSLIITGSTVNSSRVTETVVMSANTQTSVGQYVTIHSITAPAMRTNDYNVYDANGVLLASLPNNQLSTNYQVLLLSNYPWAQNLTTQTVEILFKRAFVPYVNDGDEFAAPGYEDAIYYAFQSNWDSMRKGDEERSALAAQKAAMLLGAAESDAAGKMPDARVVFKPVAGRRMFDAIRGFCNGPKDYFRP